MWAVGMTLRAMTNRPSWRPRGRRPHSPVFGETRQSRFSVPALSVQSWSLSL